jgi:hypothetical protein
MKAEFDFKSELDKLEINIGHVNIKDKTKVYLVKVDILPQKLGYCKTT